MGDKVDPSSVVHLNQANGKREDPASKLTPFKVMKGKQPYDTGTNVIAVPHLFGKGGYWDVFDWTPAVRDGMQMAGLDVCGSGGLGRDRHGLEGQPHGRAQGQCPQVPRLPRAEWPARLESARVRRQSVQAEVRQQAVAWEMPDGDHRRAAFNATHRMHGIDTGVNVDGRLRGTPRTVA